MYSCIQPVFINSLYVLHTLVHSGFKEIATESLQGPHCETECIVESGRASPKNHH